jgi:hypothetical protein
LTTKLIVNNPSKIISTFFEILPKTIGLIVI